MRDGRLGGSIMIEISSVDDELIGCTLLFLRDDTPMAEIRPHFLHRLLMSQPPPFDLPGFVWDPVYVDVANKEEAALFQAARSSPFQPDAVSISPTRGTH